MKRIIFTVMMLAMSIFLFADNVEKAIVLNHTGGVHGNMPAPADEPEVFYNTSNQTIIIDGDGFVSYYDVEIASAATLTVLISKQVNGYYDTIDVSSLPSDHVYVITIYSPTGNTYEGTFDTY